MLKDYELDCLKSELDEAFAHKQEAYRVYDEARKKTDSVYAAMFDARDALNRARAEMNDAYEEFQRAKSASREVWDEYGRIRDYNNSEIESLKYEADSEYQDMRTCFESASSEYEYGDRAMASEYSQQGHVHKDRLAELNARIRELGQEVKQAKENHIERLTGIQAFKTLFPRFLVFSVDEYTETLYNMIQRIVEEVPIYLLSCRPDQEAVELVKETVFGHNCEKV